MPENGNSTGHGNEQWRMTMLTYKGKIIPTWFIVLTVALQIAGALLLSWLGG